MRESTIPKGLYKLIECKSEEDSSNSQKFRTRFISRFKSLCLSSNFCGFSPVNWNKWKELSNCILLLLTRQVEHHGWFVLGIEPLVKNQWWKRSRIFNVNICVCNEIWILTNDSLSNLLANFSNLNSEEDFWVSIFQKGKGGNAEAHDVWKSQKKSHFSTLRVFKNRCLRSNSVSD